MAYIDIAEAVQGLLGGIEGVAAAHAYERWTNDWSRFLEFCVDSNTTNKIVSAWFVTRIQAVTERTEYGIAKRFHVLKVLGIRGLKDADASELDFQAHLDDVADALLADETLSGTCETIHPEAGPMARAHGLQIDTIEQRMFGSVLCHVADCRLCAVEVLS